MAIVSYPITPADIRSVDFKSVLYDLSPPTCSEAASTLYAAARKAEGRGETRVSAALDLISAVCRFSLDSLDPETDDPDNGPYRPIGEMGTSRTLLPSDLSDGELDALATALQMPDLPTDLVARLEDVLLVRRREYRRAHQVTAAYLAAARLLADTKGAHLTASRLHRAVRLAIRFGGTKGGRVEEITQLAEELIRDPESCARHHAVSILDVVLAYRHPDPAALADLAEELARAAADKGDFFASKSLWNRAARAWAKATEHGASYAALAEAAECSVRIAENGPSEMFRAVHLEDTSRAYRKVPGSQDRREELHRLMLESQRGSVGEMQGIGTANDVSQVAAEARTAVEGLPWLQAVFELALGILDPDDPDELQEQVIEMAPSSPLLTLIGARYTSPAGRTVSKKPDALTDGEGALHAEVRPHAALASEFDVASRIRPTTSL